MRGILRRPVAGVTLAVAVLLLAGGLWAFQPWKAFTRSTVNEAAPVAERVADRPQARPRTLAAGMFTDAEHETTGGARVLRLPDGSRVLRLTGFSTSDGPDVHVWLTDQRSGGDWGSYDDGRHVALGELKATDGNQNYAIPADASLRGLRSAVIWCDRFNVAFGTAAVNL